MRLDATVERRLLTLVPPLLVAALTLPFILTQNSWWEWANPYWLLERQAEHVSATGRPTLFLHLDSAAFYPFYVYYAGALMTALAYPAVVLGAWPTFVAATTAAAVAGYLGIWWAARSVGLSHRLAPVPALTFACTPYVLTNLYGRGAWSEFVAINAAAALFGALTATLFRPRERSSAGPMAAVVATTAVVAATHNLTLMASAIVLPLALSSLLRLRSPDTVPVRVAVARMTGSAALGLGLVAAWLLPNLWYGRDTVIAQGSTSDGILPESFGGATNLDRLLTPWPRVPEQFGHSVFPQAPALVLAWIAIVTVLASWRRPRRKGLPVLVPLALSAILLVLVANPTWWLHAPAPLRAIQYPFRLVSYVALLAAVGAIAGLRAMGSRRLLVGALAGAVVVQLAGAAWIATSSTADGRDGPASAPKHGDVHAYAEPPAFAGATNLVQVQFRVFGATVSGTATNQATVETGDPLTSDDATLVGVGPAGGLVVVPVAWSPYVKLGGQGATLAGRSGDGLVVVRVTTSGPDGRWTADVSAAHPWPLTVGRAISAVSLLVAIALGGLGLLRRGRRRRRRQRAHADAPAATSPEAVAALVK